MVVSKSSLTRLETVSNGTLKRMLIMAGRNFLSMAEKVTKHHRNTEAATRLALILDCKRLSYCPAMQLEHRKYESKFKILGTVLSLMIRFM